VKHDEWPYSRIRATATNGIACRQVLEWEHRVDDHEASNAREDDATGTKPSDNAWEEEKLDDTVQESISGKPETDGGGTEIKPSHLNWRRPDKWDECHRRHVKQGEHSIIGD